MQLIINGEKNSYGDNLTLQGLVENLSLASDRIAVELNGRVVPRGSWSSTLLNEEDRVEIVHFVGGG